MKKYLAILIGLMAYFTSCTDQDDVDIKYQVDFTVSPEKVMSGFIPYAEGDFDIPSDYNVRIRALIYDASGLLVSKTEELVKNYLADFTFSVVLPVGEYTVITSSDVVEGNSLSNIDTHYWSFSGDRKLADYTVKNEGYWGNSKDMLGLTQTELHVEGVTNKEIHIQPITALVESHISRIHSNSLITYASIQYQFTGDLIKYINQTWAFSSSAATTDDFELQRIDLTDSGYDNVPGVYSYGAVLPANNQTFKGYIQYIDADGKLKEGTTKSTTTVNFESGKQYNIIFDLNSLTVSSSVITTKTGGNLSIGPSHKKTEDGAATLSHKVIDLLQKQQNDL